MAALDARRPGATYNPLLPAPAAYDPLLPAEAAPGPQLPPGGAAFPGLPAALGPLSHGGAAALPPPPVVALPAVPALPAEAAHAGPALVPYGDDVADADMEAEAQAAQLPGWWGRAPDRLLCLPATKLAGAQATSGGAPPTPPLPPLFERLVACVLPNGRQALPFSPIPFPPTPPCHRRGGSGGSGRGPVRRHSRDGGCASGSERTQHHET